MGYTLEIIKEADNGMSLEMIVERGVVGPKGLTYIPTQAWASDANGTGWSLTPSDALKYSAFIPWLSTNQTPPTSADYAGAKWQKTGSDTTAIIVSSYADMLAITPTTSIIKCLVNSDNQNNNGEQSEYNIWPDGTIMWQASINIQNL